MTPTRQSLFLLAIWSALGLVASVWPESATSAWQAFGVVVGVLLLGDLLLALGKPRTTIERDFAVSLALGVRTKAQLRVMNASGSAKTLLVQESHPASVQIEQLPRKVRVPAHGFAEVGYALRTTERGELQFGLLDYRQASLLGFWWRHAKSGSAQAVRVYPNFRAVARYALLATSNRVSELGIRKKRRRGEGTEFHQLREYRVGDPFRQIDWRATSRMMKLISREYREERDQQIMFLLDCGRRMHSKDGELTHLDHALNAVLLLAYVALRQGDAVGLMTYGGQQRQLPPRKGASYLNAILNAVYDLSTTAVASDAAQAVEEAVKSLSRRSMIVLVSNMRDEEDEDLSSMLKIASQRHLMLLASLREVALGDTLDAGVNDFGGALRMAATHEYVRVREESHEKLERYGLLCMDVEPRMLAADLVNRYLRIKASGLL